MRPIVWGLILTIVGAIFWLLFSVIFGITFGLVGGEVPSFYMILVFISGLAMIFSLPIGAIIELVNWLKRRGQKPPSSPPPLTSVTQKYCPHCGTPNPSSSTYCGSCGRKIS